MMVSIIEKYCKTAGEEMGLAIGHLPLNIKHNY